MPTARQRRDAAHRKLARQLERRRELQRRRRQRYLAAGSVGAVVVAVILVLVFATSVFGGGGKKTAAASPSAAPSASATASATASASASASAGGTAASPFPTRTFAKNNRAPASTSGPCHYAETAASLKSPYTEGVGLPPDPSRTPSTGTVAVDMTTSHGPITLTLDRASAPCAVQSFVYLVKQNMFAQSSCPRLTTKGIYVLQCGDPSNSQQGGPTYMYKQEVSAKTSYGTGVVAMANTGQPNTTGSQFFIIYKDSSSGLQKNYSVIGKVGTGLGVVSQVAAKGAGGGTGDGKPILGLRLDRVALAS